MTRRCVKRQADGVQFQSLRLLLRRTTKKAVRSPLCCCVPSNRTLNHVCCVSQAALKSLPLIGTTVDVVHSDTLHRDIVRITLAADACPKRQYDLDWIDGSVRALALLIQLLASVGVPEPAAESALAVRLLSVCPSVLRAETDSECGAGERA